MAPQNGKEKVQDKDQKIKNLLEDSNEDGSEEEDEDEDSDDDDEDDVLKGPMRKM